MASDWDENVILDMDHLQEYTGGDKEITAKALSIFCDNAPGYLELLKQADGETWKSRAHKLKGAARSLGAWRVAKQGERAEFLEDPMQVDGRKDACIAELEDRLDELIDHIKTL
jgi:HPt (histidine-containing phosphotransfer) domain-containing protein